MSGCRAQANHRLYLASLLADSWRQALQRETIPAWTLEQAFAPAISDHLADAYGWFLLEIAGVDAVNSLPPRSCEELPALATGKALPPEVREFRRLESEGWLADMLRQRRGEVVRRQSHQNLAADAPEEPALFEYWAQQLQQLFDRMSDSLDEY